ncbi:MAG: DUF4168 domain-containing protein [Drouetiella hepatica Uher 2000/2452]|jgi:hypothetical protein|uniref:DUF4168 domain-containing protein n=1 Tax=Drouetiella hepatica Uher 2000/2452 TaxID=904376 RepID=A0A951QB68_9CYAN|nr:DUF4168 domain-containing protein [Drouetiella hepatica Uher 2000/2452]
MVRSQKYRNLSLTLQNFCKLTILTFSLISLLIGYPVGYILNNSWAWADTLPIETAPEVAPDSSRTGLGTDAISAEKVGQFVRAYLHVVTLIEQREGEIQGAETDAESLRVQQEIEAEAMGLIEAEGLTLQEYMQLLSLANIDPEFGDRIALQLQEAID